MRQLNSASMKKTKETKGAVVYDNVADGEAVTTIYLRKDGLTAPYPENIVVTVEAD